MSDMVNSAPHYTVYPVQPIAIARHLGFCLGNAVKYVLRSPFKGGAEDCKKARKYLEWEREIRQAAVSFPVYIAMSGPLDDLAGYLRDAPVNPWMEHVTEVQADFLDALSAYLESMCKSDLDQLLVLAGRLEEVIGMDHCRVCGCTDDHACEGGCSWVEEDLCSACVGREAAGNQGAGEAV